MTAVFYVSLNPAPDRVPITMTDGASETLVTMYVRGELYALLEQVIGIEPRKDEQWLTTHDLAALRQAGQ